MLCREFSSSLSLQILLFDAHVIFPIFVFFSHVYTQQNLPPTHSTVSYALPTHTHTQAEAREGF